MSGVLFLQGASSPVGMEIIPGTRSPRLSYSEAGFFIDTPLLKSFSGSNEIYKPQSLDMKANVSFFPPGWVFTLLWKFMLKHNWNKRTLFTELHDQNTADILAGSYICLTIWLVDFILQYTQSIPILLVSICCCKQWELFLCVYFTRYLMQAFVK